MAGGVFVSCTVQCAVNYWETEAEGCWIDIKSDTLIRTVALANVYFRALLGQCRAGHSGLK